MAADFSGNLTSARFDEVPVAPALLSGSTVAATSAALGLGALVVAIRFVIPLLTTPKEPLSHPRRARIHAYIVEHPGATFREVARAVDVPTGTTRHHLNVLKRGRLIVEHPHRATVRFFENHGRFDASWRREVLLREPELASLFEWIEAHPGAPQKDVLNAMEDGLKWSRSTTQHRLLRLQAEAIVHVKSQGRRKTYWAQAGKPVPGPVTVGVRV